MSRRGPSGSSTPERPGLDEELPGEGTVVDSGVMQEYAARLQEQPPGGMHPAAPQRRPGEGESEAVPLDDADLIEDEDEEDNAGTDRVALPTLRDPGRPAVASEQVAHRPTERLSPEELAGDEPESGAATLPRADLYAPPTPSTASPDGYDPSGPLTAQPTLIYRDEGAVARLVVVSGNDRGREFEIRGDEISIGRGAENDIVLADIAVSRRHLLVCREGTGFAIRDLRSGNGTIVNGRRVETAVLCDGDQIEIGNTVVRVSGVAPAPAGEPAAPGGASAYAAAPGLAPGAPAYAAAPEPAPPAYAAAPGGASAYGAAPEPAPPAYAAAPAFAPPQPFEPPLGLAPPVEQPFSTPMHEGPPPAVLAYTPVVAERGRRWPGVLTQLTATRQGKLLTFGGIGLVGLLVVAAFVKKVILPKPREAPAAAVALPAPEDSYREGVARFREGDWAGAKAAFAQVLAQVPDFAGATKYVERCDAELRSQRQLEHARRALDQGDFAAAKAALKEIDPASRVAEEATKVGRTIPLREVAALLAAAKRLRDGDDLAGARAKVEQALAIQPDHGEAVALRAELEQIESPRARGKLSRAEARRAAQEERARRAAAARRAHEEAQREEHERRAAARAAKGGGARREPARREPDRKPSVTGPVSDRIAMNHYRNREWGMAIATLKALGDRQRGRAQAKTLALAESIRKMGVAFNRAEREQSRSPAAAVRYYVQAATLDHQIGRGTHAGYLNGKIAKLARGEAQRALSGGRYEVAYEMVKAAQRFGGDDATTRTVVNSLDGKARELFERGYQIRQRRPDEAKSLWRRVLKIVPASSQWYVKAYKYLNESATRRQRDEDE